MKILVTGATGFVGNHLINELIKNNENQIIATSINLDKAMKLDWYEKVQYIPYNFNLNHIDNLYEYFNKPDLLIHLAWEGLDNYNNLIHIEKNVTNNYIFLKNLIENGLKDVNCIGTCFEYGMQNGCLSEEMITLPNTAYGLGKDTLRKFIEQFQKNKEFTFKWIRLFYMYGEGQGEKSLLSQLDRALQNNDIIFNMSKGEQIRDYLNVKDVVKNIIHIALQNSVIGVINCGSGNPISIRSLVENYLYDKKQNIKLNLGYYDYPTYEPFSFWADINKLKSINGTSVCI